MSWRCSRLWRWGGAPGSSPGHPDAVEQSPADLPRAPPGFREKTEDRPVGGELGRAADSVDLRTGGQRVSRRHRHVVPGRALVGRGDHADLVVRRAPYQEQTWIDRVSVDEVRVHVLEP